MPEEIHPGSFVGDSIEEWKKLPMWGKIAVGGGIAVVIIVIVFKARQGGGSAQLQPTVNPSTQPASTAFPGVQSGSSSVPYLPSGINPVYDAQGGLVAFQQQAAGNPTGSVSPPPTQNPLAYQGLLGSNANINFQNRTYVDSTGKSVPIPIGASDKLVQGSQNRVWYQDTGGQHLLTSGVGPPINPTTNKPFVGGGGGESIQSYARGLSQYHVQYGDNLHTVASQLRIKGGLPAWLAFNGNPDTLSHGMTLKVPND